MVALDALRGQVAAAAVGRAFASYRPAQRFLTRRHGGLLLSADTFNTYYEAKSDLAVRFMARDGTVDYDVEWSGVPGGGLGAAFSGSLRRLLESPAAVP